jgi:hypothetical protein
MPKANLSIYEKGVYYSGIKIFNNFSLKIKNVADNHKRFKTAWKHPILKQADHISLYKPDLCLIYVLYS